MKFGKTDKYGHKIHHWTRNSMLVSLVIHAALIFSAGSIVAFRVIKSKEATFEAPNIERPKMKLRRLQMPVQIQKMQKKVSKPRMQKRLSVSRMANRAMPEIKLPERSGSLMGAGGFGDGAGGAGGKLGSGAGGSLGFAVSEVNFFGQKSSGEQVFFLIDASGHMLTDEKGGIPAYAKVKEEVAKMIGRLGGATLFNIAFFNVKDVNMFSQKMVRASKENKERVLSWVQPFNRDQNLSTIGARGNNYYPKKQYEPVGKDLAHLPLAVQAAMEQGADAINIISAIWGDNRRTLTPKEQEEENRWMQREGQEYWHKPLAEARKIKAAQDEARKKKGLPPRVITSFLGFAIHECKLEIRRPPYYGYVWDQEDQIDAIQEAAIENYRRERKDLPQINVVVFAGKDEKDNDNWKFFKKLSRSYDGSYSVLKGLEGINASLD